MNLKKIKIFLPLLTLFLLYGCSIPTDFYIQNLTNEIKTIRIKYSINLVEDLKNDVNGIYSFNYRNEILSPKDFKRNKDGGLKTLEKTIVSDSIIEIKLYPKSTTRIAKTHNYRWLIENIEIDNEKIDIKEIGSKSKKIKSDYLYLID